MPGASGWHVAAILGTLCALAVVGPVRAQDGDSSRHADQVAEITKYFADLKRPRTDVLSGQGVWGTDDRGERATASDYRTSPRADRTIKALLGDLHRSVGHPADSRRIADVSRQLVRRCLELKGLPMNPTGGTVVDLSPPATSPSPGTATRATCETREPASLVVDDRSRWSILFGLAYRAEDRLIPLDPTCDVRVRVRGKNVELDWQNVPSRDRLPGEAELRPNVMSFQAVARARADFVRRFGSNALKETDLDTGQPSEELWFGADGPGRLAWTFTVSVKPGMMKPELPLRAAHYELEAHTRAQGHAPDILRSSASTLRGLTAHTSLDGASAVN
jgi:hypothetical protein